MTVAEQPAAFPVAISITCSATVTHPDGTTDEADGEAGSDVRAA